MDVEDNKMIKSGIGSNVSEIYVVARPLYMK